MRRLIQIVGLCAVLLGAQHVAVAAEPTAATPTDTKNEMIPPKVKSKTVKSSRTSTKPKVSKSTHTGKRIKPAKTSKNTKSMKDPAESAPVAH